MTVTTLVLIAAWLIVSVAVALLAGAMFNARTDADIQRRINQHNAERYAGEGNRLVAAILAKANVTELPALNAWSWSALMDLYDDPDLMPYEIPAQMTTDHDGDPAVYWKVTHIHELDDYVIARLWLAGILD